MTSPSTDAVERLRARLRQLRDLSLPLDAIAEATGVPLIVVAHLLDEGPAPAPPPRAPSLLLPASPLRGPAPTAAETFARLEAER